MIHCYKLNENGVQEMIGRIQADLEKTKYRCAIGYALYSHRMKLDGVCRLADSAMYENKRKMKSEVLETTYARETESLQKQTKERDPPMNLEYRINENYDNLTANDREVLTHIVRAKGQTAGMTSTEMAAFCHVSRTTLVRLFKKLGVSGFAEFKLLLREQAGRQEPAYLDMKEIISNYHRMVDDLKEYDYREICRVIHEAGTVYLFGTGNEQKAIGEEFKRIFLMFGKCCIDVFDYGEVEYASRNFREKDLFVMISLSGESESGIRVLRQVLHRNIKTLSMTRWTNNSAARMCEYNLYAGTKMINSQDSNGYEMVAAFYILLDMLSVNYLEYVRESHETGRTV